MRKVDGVRYVLFHVWDLKPPLYDTPFYMIEHRANARPTVHAARATYNAPPIPVLIQLMEEALFRKGHLIEGVYFQPIIAGQKGK